MRPFYDIFQYRDAVYSTKGLSSNAKAVAGALSKWADNADGYFYPKHETMAEYMGIPLGTLRRGLKELQERELLRVKTTQKGVDRTWNRNEYWLVMPDLCSPVETGEVDEDGDLCSPVETGSALERRPVLNPHATCTHSSADLCSIQSRPVPTSERTELPSELTREQPKELKSVRAALQQRVAQDSEVAWEDLDQTMRPGYFEPVLKAILNDTGFQLNDAGKVLLREQLQAPKGKRLKRDELRDYWTGRILDEVGDQAQQPEYDPWSSAAPF